ncbi:MAG TPA: 1-(5-phosphoribosyl)-5-[(5-phosphoribosylamino)methylideneamino]imidazole-4-carboxamide isomerase [Firmicutes bacterium]|nr:1-(5-phosphoribosyl)-5-[(5-phosphoribosylamino)methylideneamino]imidazole-4-carboxamide isomerase [Bacillota bacterium]
MLIIPAIDLMNGKCVRLTRGKRGTETTYSHNPAVIARMWEEMGAKRLHVVDLDAAMTGRASIQNQKAVESILKAVHIPVQLGGGIRGVEEARKALNTGVQWVIVGTVALANRQLVSRFVEELDGRLLVSIDSRDGHLVASGWTKDVYLDPLEFALDMWSMGVRTLVYTSTNRDGTLEGPDLPGLQRLLRSGASFIAAGGIGNLEDIRRLKALEPMGLVGAIVGKALYAGRLDFREAQEVAEGGGA